MPRDQFVAYISEQIGFKSGLALSFNELVTHADTTSELYEQLTTSAVKNVSLHHCEMLDAFQLILHRLGVLPNSTAYHAPTFFRLRYRGDRLQASVVEGILDLLADENDWLLPKPGKEIERFLDAVSSCWGELGLTLSKEIVDMMYLHRIGALYTSDRFRRIEWTKTVALEELFTSESLNTEEGKFIDQRFIDYLHANPEAINSMNWRKFEGLTAEFFSRSGYEVAIGSGRGDGGIDVRAWKAGCSTSNPPTILIQCKRQKSTIEQVVVKALWADVLNEGAQSGLVVTSSRIAPGAKQVSTARGYQIDFAERPSLALWLTALRSPGSGIFMQT